MKIRKNIFETFVIILFLATVTFYNFPLTGQQTADAATAATSTTTTTWPGNCGRPCQLDTSVGMLDIGSNCISIKQYYEEKMCCIKEDCGGGVCASGRCR